MGCYSHSAGVLLSYFLNFRGLWVVTGTVQVCCDVMSVAIFFELRILGGGGLLQ